MSFEKAFYKDVITFKFHKVVLTHYIAGQIVRIVNGILSMLFIVIDLARGGLGFVQLLVSTWHSEIISCVHKSKLIVVWISKLLF
uniref:Uncharacterized protein n=1 Tax=Anguilla anguilla TaxID=7936 RepID=A0A0E9XRZ0_ANGAN